jgi:peptidoglycan/LPS O-acetylase OafA/YrhL
MYVVPLEVTKPIKKSVNYPFVDWIRMIAMVGIIWAHTPSFDTDKSFNHLDNIPLYFFFMAFFKFGVICFFMISGFLLARKMNEVPPVQYFKNRVAVTLYPYLFAFAMIILLFLFKTQVLSQPSGYTFGGYVSFMFFTSALWFLPNYWISLLAILSFKKYLNSIYLGLTFLTLTIVFSYFYVYTEYARPHAHALFGFVFYLWLGYYIGRKRLNLQFEQWNLPLLILAFIGCYVLTSLESIMLFNNDLKEPLSILRFSNHLYSVVAFVLMVRVFRKPLVSKIFNPRKETFGIYLYHMFPLAVLAFAIKILAKYDINTFSDSTPLFIGWFFVKFIFVYVSTLILVKLLLRYNIGFLK